MPFEDFPDVFYVGLLDENNKEPGIKAYERQQLYKKDFVKSKNRYRNKRSVWFPEFRDDTRDPSIAGKMYDIFHAVHTAFFQMQTGGEPFYNIELMQPIRLCTYDSIGFDPGAIKLAIRRKLPTKRLRTDKKKGKKARAKPGIHSMRY